MRNYEQIAGRFLLVALTFWALAMVVPDFYRMYQPLGSFGFYANNDGLITDVQGPFAEQSASPRHFGPVYVSAISSILRRCAVFPSAPSDARVRWRR